MEGIPITRELAWLETCKELLANIPSEQREGLLRNLPIDCEALQHLGLPGVSTVVLKLVEVKAFEIEVIGKGLSLTPGEKVLLYEKPAMWCSLLQQLAFIREESNGTI